MTKEKIKTIINIYQNHINEFVNVSDEDLHKIYFEYAKSKVSIKEIKDTMRLCIREFKRTEYQDFS